MDCPNCYKQIDSKDIVLETTQLTMTVSFECSRCGREYFHIIRPEDWSELTDE